MLRCHGLKGSLRDNWALSCLENPLSAHFFLVICVANELLSEQKMLISGHDMINHITSCYMTSLPAHSFRHHEWYLAHWMTWVWYSCLVLQGRGTARLKSLGASGYNVLNINNKQLYNKQKYKQQTTSKVKKIVPNMNSTLHSIGDATNNPNYSLHGLSRPAAHAWNTKLTACWGGRPRKVAGCDDTWEL